MKNNLKIAQQHCDKTAKKVNELIGKGAKIYAEAGEDEIPEADAALVSHIDQALNSLYTLQKKLTALNESNQALHKKTKARITHLGELYKIQSLADVKYEEWSRVRLDRLLVDNMLRQGFFDSAKQLAEEKGIMDLVDIEVFEAVGRIEKSLKADKRVDLALAWCAENRSNLKKLQQDVSFKMLVDGDVDIDNYWQAHLEFELRLQQFIEMVRTGDTDKLLEAIKHAHKYLTPQEHIKGGITAAGLLAYTEDTEVQPYKVSQPHILFPYPRANHLKDLFSAERWEYLGDTFVATHHNLFGLPQEPLLHIALSAGLSALKTPACHSHHVSPSSGLNVTSPKPMQDSDVLMSQDGDEQNDNDDEPSRDGATISASLTTSVCPICSTELNELARHVPFANHTKSHVEPDPVVLPNGRIYGRERLERLNEKLGTSSGLVKDPVDPSKVFEWSEVRRVFIL